MMCMILVKQELVWEYISEDETQDDIVLLSVEVQTLDHMYRVAFMAHNVNLWGCF